MVSRSPTRFRLDALLAVCAVAFVVGLGVARPNDRGALDDSGSPSGTELTVPTARALIQEMDARGYTLDTVRRTGRIPPFFVVDLPEDLGTLSAADRTDLFLRILLPLAAESNRRIEVLRQRVRALGDAPASEADRAFLSTMRKRYFVKAPDRETLLRRLDGIPVALTLAQAADESAWGQSRFALEGNALYGQHLPKGAPGPFVLAGGASVRLAAFPSLQASTDAYLHTLNTTSAYASLRDRRASLRLEGQPATGEVLAGELIHYSARGEVYVSTLRQIIRHHGLDAFDRLPLDAEAEPVRVRSTHSLPAAADGR